MRFVRRNLSAFVRTFRKGGMRSTTHWAKRDKGRMPPVRHGIIAVTIGITVGLVAAWFSASGDARPPLTQQTQISGVASVIDGDTIEIHGARIRFHGIDAPESAQLCRDGKGHQWRCGQTAALALADYIGRSTVACEAKDKDRYGRVVAVCHKENQDLNAWMVSEGWAVAYRQYSSDYISLEETPKAAGKNIWAGVFAMPWDWRRSQQVAQTQTRAPARSQNCNIKGNLSSGGERIYHVPGGKYYNATVINHSKGERWFCSEAEARAAGWRRSKR